MIFTKDESTGHWTAAALLRGSPVTLSIDPIQGAEQCEARAAAALSLAESRFGDIETNLVSSLHALYNDTWADPEAGFPPMDEVAFLARLHPDAIAVMDEPNAMTLYFDDGDLFGGHAIEIFINEDSMYPATLVG